LDTSYHRDARPVADDVREQLVGPLVEAATVTLSEMAHAEPVVRLVYRTARPLTLGDLSAVIGLKSGPGGALVVSFPRPTATAVAGRVLAEVADAPGDELVPDCVGEIANVIAGQAKALLAETPYHFTFGTPTVLSGAGLEIGLRDGAEGLVVIFGSDLGEFAVQLCLVR
jgi:chemotaxis protein CheX